jgi:hypothetical protein
MPTPTLFSPQKKRDKKSIQSPGPHPLHPQQMMPRHSTLQQLCSNRRNLFTLRMIKISE